MKYSLLLLLCFQFASAEVVYSVYSGQWYDHYTWSTNSVPLPTDSVVIENYVIFSDSILIAATGNLLIDSCGTLCGNHCLHGHFTNYGNMYIGCFNITEPSYNYDTIISNNTSGSGVYSGFLTTYNYIYIGPNMPPCEVPPSQRSLGNCQRLLSVSEQTSAPTFQLSPNPANETITLSAETETASEPFNVLVYDITGACVRNIQPNSIRSLTIPVNDLSPGYYVIKVSNGNHYLPAKGFIIAR